MLTYTLTRNNNNLLIKANDERFNCYKYTITQQDVFVINFCEGDLDMLEQLLNDNKTQIKLEEMDEDILFTLLKPIKLKYKLKKEIISGNEHTSMIIGRLDELVTRLDLMEQRTTELEEQLQYGVIIPGYGMGVVPIDTKLLIMTFGNWSNRRWINKGLNTGHNDSYDNTAFNYSFEGHTLKPLRYLKQLEEFNFGTYDSGNNCFIDRNQCPIESDEFKILENCKNLKKIRIIGTTLDDISWTSSLKELTDIVLAHSVSLHDIRPLLDCPKLNHIDIRNCNSITNIPNFASSVTINKG